MEAIVLYLRVHLFVALSFIIDSLGIPLSYCVRQYNIAISLTKNTRVSSLMPANLARVMLNLSNVLTVSLGKVHK